ncbi:MAG: hypothetical protein RLZZ292_941 [Bacteroidota bacterium]|jgi:hypothetical protein
MSMRSIRSFSNFHRNLVGELATSFEPLSTNPQVLIKVILKKSIEIQFKGTLSIPFVTFFLDKKSNQKNQDSKEISIKRFFRKKFIRKFSHLLSCFIAISYVKNP